MALTAVGPELSSLQRRLLLDFPESKDLRTALLSNMYTGTFSGSQQGWMKERLQWIRAWTQDSAPSIRKWALSLIPGMEKEIRRTKVREEEEGY
jgi:hypothetical protein